MKKDQSASPAAKTTGELKPTPTARTVLTRDNKARAGKAGAPADIASRASSPVLEQARATQALVASLPANTNKAFESGRDNALAPPVGLTSKPNSGTVSASTLSEGNASAKTGIPAAPGAQHDDGQLTNARADGSGKVLTTNQGVPIADNQHSLKAGLRGPTLLEDFILREEITHFDHERIPERTVHARGSAAHGFFGAYESLVSLTCAAPFAEAGKGPPVFVHFSTVANNQRDGIHRQTVHRGRVAFEPNSLGGGCPFQAGARGFVSFPQPVEGEKLRGSPEKSADHCTQATLFYESQTTVEQAHIAAGVRFELSKLTVPAIRERMLASLVNASPQLAQAVADGLGKDLPAPLPRVLEKPAAPEVWRSPALSLTALPGDGGIRTRKVALLAAQGVDGAPLLSVQARLEAAGAATCVIAARLGSVTTSDGSDLKATARFENSPSVLFDAVVMPGGEKGVDALLSMPRAVDFVAQQYRHGKSLLAIGESKSLLDLAGVVSMLDSGDAEPGVHLSEVDELDTVAGAFALAMGKHRHPQRELNLPPL